MARSRKRGEPTFGAIGSWSELLSFLDFTGAVSKLIERDRERQFLRGRGAGSLGFTN